MDSKRCRVCLSRKGQFFLLTVDIPIDGERKSLLDLLKAFAPNTNVSLTDKKPKFICHNCTRIVYEGVSLHLKLRRVNKVLDAEENNLIIQEDLIEDNDGVEPTTNDDDDDDYESIMNSMANRSLDEIRNNIIELVQGNRISKYACEECDYKTGIEEKFIKHKESHESQGVEALCDICGKKFHLNFAYKMHMLKVHITNK